MLTLILLPVALGGWFCFLWLLREGDRQIEKASAALDEPNCTRWDYGVRRSYSLAIVTRRDVA